MAGTDGGGASVELTVNGQQVSAVVSDATTLLQLLRQDLDLYGVRTGCTMGECGACTVLLEGTAMRSCDLPATAAKGRSVTTPEGLGTPDAPHPVQQAFLDTQAAQCGYCVNGMIMTVAARARSGVGADTDPREVLADHLCRCGTHGRLLAATEQALGLAPRGWVADGGTVSAADSESIGRNPINGRHGAFFSAVAADPRVERWLELSGGRVQVLSGKVELGQGIRTAFAQIVAAGLGVPMTMVDVVPTTTGRSPDQQYTAGSQSIEEGGAALAMAAAAFRRLLLDRAAEYLGCTRNELAVMADGVQRSDGGGMSWAKLEAGGPLTGMIDVADQPDWRSTPPLGSTVLRDDLRTKLTGAPAFLQDMTLPGMVHARVLLPPHMDSQLSAFDDTAVRDLPGVVDVVQDSRVIIVIAERDEQGIRAIQRLARDVRWSGTLDLAAGERQLLRTAPAQTLRIRNDDDIDERLAAGQPLTATYFKPYQAHGSVAPSAAIARVDGDDVQVWCHSQGVYPLRRELSALFGIDQEHLRIEHVDGPGCYGQNGADDAAAFAVAAARAVPGRPVRLQLSVEDEFGWEPYGPAMLVDLAASLSDDGRILAWRHRSFTDAHVTRPNGDGDRLALQWLRDGGSRPWPGTHEAGARNGPPLYDIPALDVSADHIQGPVRTGPLRSLGSYTNVFAGESFVDELAEAAGCDPIEFRLRHLTDARARRVLEVVAERSGWNSHIGPSGRGRGVALVRYKGIRAYVALVAHVDVDGAAGGPNRLRVKRVWAACDAGTVINPDGVRSQVEGGILQGISRALFEASSVGPMGVQERDWTSYRTLRFADVPRTDVVVVTDDSPPLGVGESSSPPVPAALANAIDDAIGVRLRDLPLTAEQVERRLLAMDTDEAARVRL